MSVRSTARAGFTVVELLLALAIAGILAVAALGLFLVTARSGTRSADEIELVDATGAALAVLTLETRALLPPDVRAIGSDSLALRAFRGTGVVCARGARGPVLRYAGLRDPDPAKDSIVVATSHPERTEALLAVLPAAPACAALTGESLVEIVSAPDSLRPGDVALFFESGAYHLNAGALRYRAAGGTRQPLTADVLETDSSRLALRTRVSRPTESIALRAVLTGRGRIAAATGEPRRRRDSGAFFLQLGTPLDSLDRP